MSGEMSSEERRAGPAYSVLSTEYSVLGTPHSGLSRASATAQFVPLSRQDPWPVRWGLTIAALAILGVLVILPLANVFVQALGEGPRTYWKNLFQDADTRNAILLTLTVA